MVEDDEGSESQAEVSGQVGLVQSRDTEGKPEDGDVRLLRLLLLVTEERAGGQASDAASPSGDAAKESIGGRYRRGEGAGNTAEEMAEGGRRRGEGI